MTVVFPGGPDLPSEEEGSEEAEAVVEIGDAGLLLVQLQVGRFEELLALDEGLLGVLGGLGEDDEVVGVADQFAAASSSRSKSSRKKLASRGEMGEPCGTPQRTGRT